MFRRLAQKGDPRAYEPERLKTLMDQAARQVFRLTRLVDDMLDISRVRSGKFSLEREEFDICELVRDSIDTFQAQFGHTGKTLPQLEADCKVVGLWDRLRIEQVVANLFTNAIRYGEGKPVVVRVEDKGDGVLLSVVDHGIGIEKKLHVVAAGGQRCEWSDM